MRFNLRKRYAFHLPDMLPSLPRQISSGAVDGCFPEPLRPSPNIGRVGIYNCPFGACSRFTRVTACQVAAALKAYICSQGFSRKVSLSHCLGSYRDEPTISRTGLAPVGDLRLRGAPTSCGHARLAMVSLSAIYPYNIKNPKSTYAVIISSVALLSDQVPS